MALRHEIFQTKPSNQTYFKMSVGGMRVSSLVVWTSDQTLLVLIFLLKYYQGLIIRTPGLRTHTDLRILIFLSQLAVICNAGNVISLMKINGNLISTISLIAPKFQSHNLPIFISPSTTKIPKSLKLKPQKFQFVERNFFSLELSGDVLLRLIQKVGIIFQLFAFK